MAITDLTNTTWKLNDFVDATYIQENSCNLDFVSNGVSYTNINVYDDMDSWSSQLRYNGTVVAINVLGNYESYSFDENSQAYRIITITGGEDVTKPEIIAWLGANGELQAPRIVYDGKTITTLEAGQTATLACKDKVAKTDIIVSFANSGTITYNGITTNVESGKTAILNCSGKVMKSDVQVASLETTTDDIQGTWYLNDSVDVVPIIDGAGDSVKFTCNGAIYTGMEGSAPDVIRYWAEDSGRIKVYDGGWESSEYQVINVLEYDDAYGFSEWLKANGKKGYTITCETTGGCEKVFDNPTGISKDDSVIVKFSSPHDHGNWEITATNCDLMYCTETGEEWTYMPWFSDLRRNGQDYFCAKLSNPTGNIVVTACADGMPEIEK